MINFIGKTPSFLKNHISTSIDAKDAKDSLTPQGNRAMLFPLITADDTDH
jgi:hypothetical protein